MSARWLGAIVLLFMVGCSDTSNKNKELERPTIDESEAKELPISKSESNLSINLELPPEPVSE